VDIQQTLHCFILRDAGKLPLLVILYIKMIYFGDGGMLRHSFYKSAFFANWLFARYCSLSRLNRNGVTASENESMFESGGGRRSAIPVAVNPPLRRGCLAGITRTSVPESGSVVAKYRFTWRHQAPQFIRFMYLSLTACRVQ
jgi:hypothetical protein